MVHRGLQILISNQAVPGIDSGINTSHPAFVSPSPRESVPALVVLALSTTLETSCVHSAVRESALALVSTVSSEIFTGLSNVFVFSWLLRALLAKFENLGPAFLPPSVRFSVALLTSEFVPARHNALVEHGQVGELFTALRHT